MTVNLKLAEVIVTAAVTKLQTNMPTRVAAINAEKSGTITIAAPDNSAYITSGANQFPVTPAIVVAEGRTDFEAEFEGPHSFITSTDLLVYILEADADRSRLGVRLQRQVRAVIESLWDSAPLEQLTGSAFRIFPRYTRPGPVSDPEKDDIAHRGWYAVVFKAEQLEGS